MNDMIGEENLSRNLNRYWVDNDSAIIMRKWMDEEYQSTNPYTHIFEKYWSFRCPNCSFIPIPVLSKEEAERTQVRHINKFICRENRKRHKGIVEYRYHELICWECKEEFLEDLGVWVYKETYYK